MVSGRFVFVCKYTEKMVKKFSLKYIVNEYQFAARKTVRNEEKRLNEDITL